MNLMAQSVSSLSPVILHQSVCEVVSYPLTIFACLMSHCIHSSCLIIRTIFHWPHPRCPKHSRCFSDTGLSPVPKDLVEQRTKLDLEQSWNTTKKTPKQVTLLLLTFQCTVSSAVLGHHLCFKSSTNDVMMFNSSYPNGMHQLSLCSVFGLSTITHSLSL